MNDKNKYQELIRVFESIEIENIETLLFCWESPESGWHHSKDRINIILEGSDSMQYYSHGQLQTVTLHAPALYYCTRNSWLMQNDLNKNVSISICFLPEYVRAMRIDQDGIHAPPTDKDIFLHTREPLPPGSMALLNAIEKLWIDGEQKLARSLINELFKLAVRHIKNDTHLPGRFAPRIWDEMITYLRDHRSEMISRAQMAKKLRCSPGYVSRLAKKFNGMDYVTLATTYRLEHAAKLLTETNMTIAEIAEEAGYEYLSYFYKQFKKHYGVTPRQYRDQQS